MERTHFRLGPAALLIAGLAIAAIVLPGTAQAATTKFSYHGMAFGTSANVGKTVISGRSALVSIGACTTQVGLVKENQVATVDALPTLGAMNVYTRVASNANNVRALATVENANLLNGLITASEVRAESITAFNGAGFTHTNDSTFLGLKIAGQSYGANVPPNTRVDLEGFGYVVLNEQARSARAQELNMIHVFITKQNVLNIPVGAEIIVSHAQTELFGPVVALVGASAYGSYATAGDGTVLSGKSFPAGIGCEGGYNSNTGLGVNVPNGILSTGTIKDEAWGKVAATYSQAWGRSAVQTTNIGDGFIKATTITAKANAWTDGSTTKLSSSGSSLLGLVVDGNPVVVSGSATINISGVGTLYVMRVIKSASAIQVRGLELVVTESNSHGLPVGSDIRVAVAAANVQF